MLPERQSSQEAITITAIIHLIMALKQPSHTLLHKVDMSLKCDWTKDFKVHCISRFLQGWQIFEKISLNLKLPKLRPDSCNIFTEECNLIFEPLLSRRSQVANIFPMDGWVQKSYGTIESCFQGIFGFGLGLVDGGCIPEGIESGGGVREQQASVPGLNASTSKLYSTDSSAAAKVLCKLSYLRCCCGSFLLYAASMADFIM